MSNQDHQPLSHKNDENHTERDTPEDLHTDVGSTRLPSMLRQFQARPQSLTPKQFIQLQRLIGNRATSRLVLQRRQTASGTPNQTGLSDALKAGVEHLSGVPLDDVHVHRDSAKPGEFQAAAYTQGTDIHVAPGQESHLAHEAWHVVQQKQGRVAPLSDINSVPINDSPMLEREAEQFGTQALQVGASLPAEAAISAGVSAESTQSPSSAPIQFYDASGLAGFFNQDGAQALRVYLGDVMFKYLIKQTPNLFAPFLQFFITQRNAGAFQNDQAQVTFLEGKEANPAEYQLAQDILLDLNYVATHAQALFALLAPYVNPPTHLAYAKNLITAVNRDPVAAGPVFTYLGLHRGTDDEFNLAKEILVMTNNNATLATPLFPLLAPYLTTPAYIQSAKDVITRLNNDHVAAGPILTYLGLHRGTDDEFALAKEALVITQNNPDTAEPIYKYLAEYKAVDEKAFAAAKRILTEKGNDPVVAKSTMQKTKEYGYFESVQTGASTMATNTATEETDQLVLTAQETSSKFKTKYKQELGIEITQSITRKTFKVPLKEKFKALMKVEGDASSEKFNVDIAEPARKRKILELDGAAATITNDRPNLESGYNTDIANTLKPLYAFSDGEAAANWLIAQAGTDIDKLKTIVGLMTTCLTEKIALEVAKVTVTALKELDLADGQTLIKHHAAYKALGALAPMKSYQLVSKLATAESGDLDPLPLADLFTRLAPLSGLQIEAFINLLYPVLKGSEILEIVTLTNVAGDKIRTFVNEYVPNITAKEFLSLVKGLKPCTPAEINAFVGLLKADLMLRYIVEVVIKLAPLDGTQMTAFVKSLQTPAGALKGTHILTLIKAMEGTPGDKIDAMTKSFRRLGDVNGMQVYQRVSQMRGSMDLGGNKSKDVTDLDGERLLSGTQIAIRAEQETAGKRDDELIPDNLKKYPHSNIDPVGRTEDLLWEDCDSTVVRDGKETAADKKIRQQLALNAIFQLGGVNKAIAQQVFAKNEGQRPRALKTAADEDALSGGHTVGRHVIGGGGLINTVQKLQQRADGLIPTAPCPNIAGAYANMGASQTGMQNALNAKVTAVTWAVIRHDLIRGLLYDFRIAAAVSGHVARNGLAMNNAPSRVYLPLQGANKEGGFTVFHSWPEL